MIWGQVASKAPRPSLDRTVLAISTELRLHLEGPADLGQSTEAALAESARQASGADLLDLDAMRGTARLRHPWGGGRGRWLSKR
jgi:hypothetical protein